MARLLDTIIASTLKRVKETPFVVPKPPKTDAKVRALHREYIHSERQRDWCKAQLKARGWDVNYRNRLDGIDSLGHQARKRYDTETQKRLDKVRNLRDDALVDTLGMNPVELKAYLIKLKQKLGKI